MTNHTTPAPFAPQNPSSGRDDPSTYSTPPPPRTPRASDTLGGSLIAIAVLAAGGWAGLALATGAIVALVDLAHRV